MGDRPGVHYPDDLCPKIVNELIEQALSSPDGTARTYLISNEDGGIFLRATRADSLLGIAEAWRFD